MISIGWFFTDNVEARCDWLVADKVEVKAS